MTAQFTPLHLDLKKDRELVIEWQDGVRCVYSLSLLRSMCPCAQCKQVRAGSGNLLKKPTLTILPGNYAQPLSVLSAELVGNYALRLEWSDNHGSGIYSFQYLRDICPPTT